MLFVIDLATRRVVIAGITTNPNEAWLLQMARNLTDTETGMLRGLRYLVVTRRRSSSLPEDPDNGPQFFNNWSGR